jgi:hypothetical protein
MTHFNDELSIINESLNDFSKMEKKESLLKIH